MSEPIPEPLNKSPGSEAVEEVQEPIQEQSEISIDFDDEPQTYEEDAGNVGAWRTIEQRKKLIIYRKLTGHWPDEVSRETGLQSYYEVRYFSTREEHKRKYANQHALARRWWTEYKEQTGAAETGKMGRVKPNLYLVSNE